MKHIVHFEPLTPQTYHEYIKVGTRAYDQHYVHLWPNGNSTPYISTSFTIEVLKKEEYDTNTLLYLIKWNGVSVGILKFSINSALGSFSSKEALYVDKIYLLKEHSGKGIGKKTLQFVQLRAKEMGKKIIWLDTMQKGPALNFYLQNGFDIHGKSQVQLPTILEKEKDMYNMIKRL
jgi:GNAT superfamily N-acetyltransferase